jgi:hypothetical protein
MDTLNELLPGLLVAARLCRKQPATGRPEDCAREIERCAADIMIRDLHPKFEEQAHLHDDGGW